MQIIYANVCVSAWVGVNVQRFFSFSHVYRMIAWAAWMSHLKCASMNVHFFSCKIRLQSGCMGLCVVWLRARPLKDSSHSVIALPPKPPSYMLSHWIDYKAVVPGATFILNIISVHLWNREASSYMRRSSKNKLPNGSMLNQSRSPASLVLNIQGDRNLI